MNLERHIFFYLKQEMRFLHKKKKKTPPQYIQLCNTSAFLHLRPADEGWLVCRKGKDIHVSDGSEIDSELGVGAHLHPPLHNLHPGKETWNKNI